MEGRGRRPAEQGALVGGAEAPGAADAEERTQRRPGDAAPDRRIAPVLAARYRHPGSGCARCARRTHMDNVVQICTAVKPRYPSPMPLRRLSVPMLGLIALLVTVASVLGQQPGVHPVSGRRFALPMSVEGAPWL